MSGAALPPLGFDLPSHLGRPGAGRREGIGLATHEVQAGRVQGTDGVSVAVLYRK